MVIKATTTERNIMKKYEPKTVIIEDVDPFTRSLLFKVKEEMGFKTLGETMDHLLYCYYENTVHVE